eukprot:TRINITY_DN958_c5_g1_i1.p1 TRINITY_DN958_c5_g1~~TRINITY_DN958_c5_g1_i1.p1  ORF type:complete len:416 (+),score=139.85 TRINITY_DN958_c5_g1_i1:85-1332(+)
MLAAAVAAAAAAAATRPSPERMYAEAQRVNSVLQRRGSKEASGSGAGPSPSAANAGILGATHWQGCYQVNKDVHFLRDGAESIAAMGSKVLKVILAHPTTNYPWNSPKWPEFGEEGYRTAAELAAHEYYKDVFSMPFDTIALVAYSTVEYDNNYFCGRGKVTPEREAEETKQFKDLTTHLLQTYPGKKFILHHWEGDWAVRCGDYDAEKPAKQYAFNNMVRWLAARQAGVTQARDEWERSSKAAASATVLHAAEVNRVGANLANPETHPEMTTEVIPHVALDMVAYSNYDTSWNRTEFELALDWIEQHHVRTAHSPAKAVLVSEYGLGQNWYSQPAVQTLVENVVSVALAWGCPHIIFWEVYCNEHTDEDHPYGEGRCDRQTGQTTRERNLAGFWLVKPDGSYSWPRTYLRSLIV